MQEKNGHASQDWVIKPVAGKEADGVVNILYAANPSFALNLHGNEHADDATINLWEVTAAQSVRL